MLQTMRSGFRWVLRERAALFLASLVVLVATYPTARTNSTKLVLGIYLLQIMLLWFIALTRSVRERVAVGMLSLVSIGCVSTLGWMPESSTIHAAAAVSIAVFFAVILGRTYSMVHHAAEVSPAVLQSAVSVYLMMALVWSELFELLEILQPGSFAFAPGPEALQGDIRSSLLYFSVITLTTVGYGDITPVSPPARSLAMLESVGGVLYMGITIAKLTSLYRSKAEA
jgi:hypothetical protein